MLILNRPSFNADNDDEHYETKVKRQANTDKKYATLRNFKPVPIGSAVAVQREDGGPWSNGIRVGKRDESHNDRSYKIYVIKTGWLTMRNRKRVGNTHHIRAILHELAI